jgi:hypothetical protein
VSKIIRGFWPFREGGGPRDYIACCKCPKTQSIHSAVADRTIDRVGEGYRLDNVRGKVGLSHLSPAYELTRQDLGPIRALETRPEGAQAPHGAFPKLSREPAQRCAWVEDGVPCPNPVPYPGARGHGHLCDAHVEAEMRLARAARVVTVSKPRP